MARYIDQTNIVEYFEEHVKDESLVLGASSSNIVKLHIGRKNATAYFFQDEKIKTNRKLWDTVRSLTDFHRSLLSQNLLIDSLRHQLKEAEKKAVEMKQSQEDQISKVAFTYTTLLNPTFRADQFVNGDALDPQLRATLSLNCQLVKYIFCSDTILDSDNKELQAITVQSLELKVGQADMGKMHSTHSQSRGGSHQKPSGNRMDAEKPHSNG